MLTSLIIWFGMAGGCIPTGQAAPLVPQHLIGLPSNRVEVLLNEKPAVVTVTGLIDNPSIMEFYAKSRFVVCYGPSGVVIRSYRVK